MPQSAEPNAQGGTDEGTSIAGYTGLRVVQPSANETVRSNEGRVPVSVTMQPVLQAQHRVRFFLDSVRVQPDFASQSGTLNGVARGTHSLYAQVIDESGRVLGSTQRVSFTLRQASVLFRNDEPKPEEPEKPIDPYAPSQADGSYQPGDSPNYSPPPSSGYNPSFRPNYNVR